MTLTKHSFIGLKDLLAVSLVCDDCGSSATINIEKYKNIPERCPNCRKAWYDDRSPGGIALNKMLQAVEDVQKFAEGAPCQIKFEVNNQLC